MNMGWMGDLGKKRPHRRLTLPLLLSPTAHIVKARTVQNGADLRAITQNELSVAAVLLVQYTSCDEPGLCGGAPPWDALSAFYYHWSPLTSSVMERTAIHHNGIAGAAPH